MVCAGRKMKIYPENATKITLAKMSVCACHKLAFISSSCKCQKQVVFVVKRYTVHKAKIRQYAVGGLKSNTQNARERGTSLSHVIVQMSMLQIIELELNQLSRSQ